MKGLQIKMNVKDNEVIEFAKRKHGSQKRKGGGLYFNHVLEVGDMAAKIALDLVDSYPYLAQEITMIKYAGYLHDTIEDTNTNYDHILQLTNDTVAQWVASLSNDKRLPKVLRRTAYNNVIKNSCIEIKIIKLSDIYSNLIGIQGNEGEQWIKEFKMKAHEMLKSLDTELSKNEYYGKCMQIIRSNT